MSADGDGNTRRGSPSTTRSAVSDAIAVVPARDGAGGYRLQAREPTDVADANAFLEMLAIRGLSLATLRAYAFDLLLLYRWLERSQLKLTALDPSKLLGFIEDQRRSGAQPNSINRRLTTSEQLFGFVTGRPLNLSHGMSPAPHYRGRGRDHDLGLHLLRRVARRKLRVKTALKVVEPLTTDQVAALLGSLRRYRDLAIVYLMLLCGLRSGEVLAIRLPDVDAQERRLRVRGKGNRERVLPLADALLRVLSDYMRLERPRNAATDRLFVVLQGRRRGAPMTAAGLRTLFRHRRRARKGLANANAHRLRHTFGADMARSGVRLPILQRMMGHADGKTTLRYVNLSMTDIAAEYARAIASIERRYDGGS